jgi:hypothetical protein
MIILKNGLFVLKYTGGYDASANREWTVPGHSGLGSWTTMDSAITGALAHLKDASKMAIQIVIFPAATSGTNDIGILYHEI